MISDCFAAPRRSSSSPFEQDARVGRQTAVEHAKRRIWFWIYSWREGIVSLLLSFSFRDPPPPSFSYALLDGNRERVSRVRSLRLLLPWLLRRCARGVCVWDKRVLVENFYFILCRVLSFFLCSHQKSSRRFCSSLKKTPTLLSLLLYVTSLTKDASRPPSPLSLSLSSLSSLSLLSLSFIQTRERAHASGRVNWNDERESRRCSIFLVFFRRASASNSKSSKSSKSSKRFGREGRREFQKKTQRDERKTTSRGELWRELV